MKKVLGLMVAGAVVFGVAGPVFAAPSCDVVSVDADQLSVELGRTTARYPEITPLFETTIKVLKRSNDFNVVMASLTPSLGSCAVLSGSQGCMVVAEKITELAVRKHRVARSIEKGECVGS
jgi:hypothetical protein